MRNLSWTTLLNLPVCFCKDRWTLSLVSALGSRQPGPILFEHIAVKLPR